jgi:hypothetical protein
LGNKTKIPATNKKIGNELVGRSATRTMPPLACLAAAAVCDTREAEMAERKGEMVCAREAEICRPY